MSRDPSCIFCAIAAGDAPALFVYEGDTVMAFLDINPLAEGHTLVVPRDHARHLSDLDPDTGREMFAVAQRVAAAQRASGIPCDGVNLFLSDGAAAGQEVMHCHLHVVPRAAGDGIRLLTRGTGTTASLDDTAAAIKRGFETAG